MFALFGVFLLFGISIDSASAKANSTELDYWETVSDSTENGQGYVYVPPGGKLGLYVDSFDGLVTYQVIGSNGKPDNRYSGTLAPSSKPVNIVTPNIGVGSYKVKLYCYEPPYYKGCHGKATISSQK